jgi:hypothetical protein
MINGINAEVAEGNGQDAEDLGIVLTHLSLSASSAFVLRVLRVEMQP